MIIHFSNPGSEETRSPDPKKQSFLGAPIQPTGKLAPILWEVRGGGDAEPLPLFQVTDGCGSPLHRLRSPLHSGPGSPAGGSFCLEPPGLRRSLDEDEPPPSPLARYRPLHNAASHEGLAATSGSPPRSAPSSDSSPSFVRRYPRAELHSEGEPGRRGVPCRRALEPQSGQGLGGCRGDGRLAIRFLSSFTEAYYMSDIAGPKQSIETALASGDL